MGWWDKVLGYCGTAVCAVDPAPDYEGAASRIDAMPLTDRVHAWRNVCTTRFRDHTSGAYIVVIGFGRASHNEARHSVAFIEAVFHDEPKDEILLLLANVKSLGQLLVFHAATATPLLQEMALRELRLRWLLGGKVAAIENGVVEDKGLAKRLLAICDGPAYGAWEEKAGAVSEPIDFEKPIRDLAAKWVEIASRSDVEIERDQDWCDLYDYQHELTKKEPSKALALVKAVLEIEDNPNLLGSLPAGMLQDLIPSEDGPVTHAVVAEATRNLQIQDLLCDAWFDDLSPEVVAPLTWARRHREV